MNQEKQISSFTTGAKKIAPRNTYRPLKFFCKIYMENGF